VRTCAKCGGLPLRTPKARFCASCIAAQKAAYFARWYAANRPQLMPGFGALHPLRVAEPKKTCARCGETKSSIEFLLNSHGALLSACKPCSGIEKRLAETVKKRAAPVRTCTRCGVTAAADNFKPHKGWCRACEKNYAKHWWRSNPDKVRAREERRRARAAGVARIDLTHEDWMAILEYHDHRCAYCLERARRLEKDHVIALVRGGDHTADNIVPACRSCNATKHVKPVFMMAGVA
jgi:hypothetical protein